MVDIQYSENKSSDKIRYHPDGFDLSLHLPIDSTKAFDIFADLNQLADLVGLPRYRQLTPPPVGLGSRWIMRHGLYKIFFENTVFEKPVRIVRKKSGAAEGEIDIHIEPANLGTVVSISVRTTKLPLFASKSEANRAVADFYLAVETKLSELEELSTPNAGKRFWWNLFKLIFLWIVMACTLVFIFNSFNQGNEISMKQFLETYRSLIFT